MLLRQPPAPWRRAKGTLFNHGSKTCYQHFSKSNNNTTQQSKNYYQFYLIHWSEEQHACTTAGKHSIPYYLQIQNYSTEESDSHFSQKFSNPLFNPVVFTTQRQYDSISWQFVLNDNKPKYRPIQIQMQWAYFHGNCSSPQQVCGKVPQLLGCISQRLQLGQQQPNNKQSPVFQLPLLLQHIHC